MFKGILARIRQGHRTIAYPRGKPPALPALFRGRPELDASLCPATCELCAAACPTGAIRAHEGIIDAGLCLYCGSCAEACPAQAIAFTRDWRLAVRSRERLLLRSGQKEIELARELDRRMKSHFGRSLKLRQVSAGGCGACEADVNVLGTIGWDLGRFGIQFVASPRHADGMLITGPITKNMELAVKKTWEAIPSPKIVIAVGSCAVAGGPFLGNPECNCGVASVLPVDLFIPGCPPHPLTILDGLLRLLGRIDGDGRGKTDARRRSML